MPPRAGWGKTKMKDWRATARNWMRRVDEFKNNNNNNNNDNGNNQGSNYENAVRAINAMQAECEEWERNGGDAQLDALF